MSETYSPQELKVLIKELLTIIVAGPTSNSEAYVQALKQLDTFKGGAYRDTLPWDLRHYLGNRSYLKALNFVDNW